MTRSILSFSLLGFALLPGCNEPTFTTESFDYPEMVFNSQWIEFGEVDQGEASTRSFTITNTGELSLGIGDIYAGAGHSDAFSFSYDAASIECIEGDASEVDASSKNIDTAGGGDTGVGTDTGASGDEEASKAIELAQNCRLTVDVVFEPSWVGKAYGSIVIETVTQQEGEELDLTEEELAADNDEDGFTGRIDCDDNDPDVGMPPAGSTCAGDEEQGAFEPAYFADLDQTKAIVYLDGDGLLGQGIAVVQPRYVDFGHLWTGETEAKYIELSNTGDGDLVLGEPVLAPGCDEAYSITWAYEDGDVLEGGTSNVLEVSFNPSDQSAAYCLLNVMTDDANNPSISVTLSANNGIDPDNESPTVEIFSPAPGYEHYGADSLKVEMRVFDVNQPASSLLCKLKSTLLVGASLASCTPTDASGHVELEVDLNEVDPGVDTLLVQVTDASEARAYASVPIRVRSSPGSGTDLDGDGFTVDEGDCDNASITVYPKSAELYDGVDNDCDTLIDEDTVGSDDDGDTFSEVDGDCNDRNDEIYPGAPEMDDSSDNNCNGQVDEGTDLFDDDGDGYAEVNNDCDDNDPAVNPGAIEFCDGFDNDCNGLTDKLDGCVEIDTEPIIVGGIAMERTACEEGEVVPLSLFVYDADGQSPFFSWSVTEGGGEVDDPTAQSVNWTAPQLPRGSDGRLYSVYAVAVDGHGNQVWDFDEIAVYPQAELNGRKFIRVVQSEQSGGCSSVGGSPLFGYVGILGLGLVLLRRRSD